MASISDFKAQLSAGGARPNQFMVQLTFPAYVTFGALAGQQAQFLCKAAQLPAVIIEDVPVNYRGRVVHFAGERSFQPWNITIYNDNSFNIRNSLEVWSNGIQEFATTAGKTSPKDYQVDLKVFQLGRNGETLKEYKFVDSYPAVLSPIQLDYDANNVIETFEVEFMYNYYTSNTGGDGASVSINTSVSTPVGTFPIPF